MHSDLDLFLVRHGVSDASSHRQRPETQLSPEGRYQASRVAQRLIEMGANTLLSSPITRTKETGLIISKITKIPNVVVTDLREIERPNWVYGAPLDSERNLLYKEGWKAALRAGDLNWKLQGQGESIAELLNRIDLVIGMVSKKYSGKKVILDSHGVFLAFLMTRLFLGDKARSSEIIDMARSHYLRHGGLAHVSLVAGKWQLNHFDRS